VAALRSSAVVSAATLFIGLSIGLMVIVVPSPPCTMSLVAWRFDTGSTITKAPVWSAATGIGSGVMT
jgi:hypothetical protein